MELIPLAIASAFWPLLLVVVIVALRARDPTRLLASFLAGGLLTTVVIGVTIVIALQGADFTTGSRSTLNPSVRLAAGVLSLVAALVLWRRRPNPVAGGDTEDAPAPGRLERALDHGAAIAFVTGVVVNIVPGVVPFVALADIADMNLRLAPTVALVSAFYVVMFAFVEIPLAGHLVAPEATERVTTRFKTWLDHNARRLACGALAAAGVYLVIGGVAGLAG